MKLYEDSQYSDKVNSIFEQLHAELKEALPEARIEHIGASSVEGSVSKGDLDVFVGVPAEEFKISLEAIKEKGFQEKQDTLRTESLCMLITDKYNYDLVIQ